MQTCEKSPKIQKVRAFFLGSHIGFQVICPDLLELLELEIPSSPRVWNKCQILNITSITSLSPSCLPDLPLLRPLWNYYKNHTYGNFPIIDHDYCYQKHWSDIPLKPCYAKPSLFVTSLAKQFRVQALTIVSRVVVLVRVERVEQHSLTHDVIGIDLSM